MKGLLKNLGLILVVIGAVILVACSRKEEQGEQHL